MRVRNVLTAVGAGLLVVLSQGCIFPRSEAWYNYAKSTTDVMITLERPPESSYYWDDYTYMVYVAFEPDVTIGDVRAQLDDYAYSSDYIDAPDSTGIELVMSGEYPDRSKSLSISKRMGVTGGYLIAILEGGYGDYSYWITELDGRTEYRGRPWLALPDGYASGYPDSARIDSLPHGTFLLAPAEILTLTAVGGSRVVATLADGRIMSMDAATESMSEVAYTDRTFEMADVDPATNTLYVLDTSAYGTVYALDLDSGAFSTITLNPYASCSDVTYIPQSDEIFLSTGSTGRFFAAATGVQSASGTAYGYQHVLVPGTSDVVGVSGSTVYRYRRNSTSIQSVDSVFVGVSLNGLRTAIDREGTRIVVVSASAGLDLGFAVIAAADLSVKWQTWDLAFEVGAAAIMPQTGTVLLSAYFGPTEYENTLNVVPPNASEVSARYAFPYSRETDNVLLVVTLDGKYAVGYANSGETSSYSGGLLTIWNVEGL